MCVGLRSITFTRDVTTTDVQRLIRFFDSCRSLVEFYVEEPVYFADGPGVSHDITDRVCAQLFTMSPCLRQLSICSRLEPGFAQSFVSKISGGTPVNKIDELVLGGAAEDVISVVSAAKSVWWLAMQLDDSHVGVFSALSHHLKVLILEVPAETCHTKSDLVAMQKLINLSKLHWTSLEGDGTELLNFDWIQDGDSEVWIQTFKHMRELKLAWSCPQLGKHAFIAMGKHCRKLKHCEIALDIDLDAFEIMRNNSLRMKRLDYLKVREVKPFGGDFGSW